MAKIQEMAVIARPVSEVFSFIARAEEWPKWHAGMLEASQTSPGAACVGATFRGVNREMGLRMPWTCEATEYEPDRKWGEKIVSGGTVYQGTVILEPLGAGTMIKLDYDLSVGGALKVLAPVVTSMMRRQMKGNLRKLKSILEGRE